MTRKWSLGVIVLMASQVVAQDGSWQEVLLLEGVRDVRVVQAMERVRRSDFLPASQRRFAMDWPELLFCQISVCVGA